MRDKSDMMNKIREANLLDYNYSNERVTRKKKKKQKGNAITINLGRPDEHSGKMTGF